MKILQKPIPGVMRAEYTCPKCGGNQTVQITVGIQEKVIPADIWGKAAGRRPRIKWEMLVSAGVGLYVVYSLRAALGGMQWWPLIETLGMVGAALACLEFRESKDGVEQRLDQWKRTKRWESRAWICLRDHESWDPDDVAVGDTSGGVPAYGMKPVTEGK